MQSEHSTEGAVGVIFDIGATGATLEEVVPVVAGMFERLVFASPCTSAVAARKFVEAAVAGGMNPRRLAIVANEGFFGLHGNGTFLSFQLPGTVTSRGNIALSRAVYPHPSFCHIGAGGLAANWPGLYEEELFQDEEDFRCQLRRFESLGEAMNRAEVRWPDDFGGKPV